MAGSLKTTNYQLAKYAPDDITSWLTDFNGNMDLIDAGMQANKQAATQAQDGVDSLEAEYSSLLQTVNGHTTSIDANEKAIAANTASIAELGDVVNNISVGTVIYKTLTDGDVTKSENILDTFNIYGRNIGGFFSGSISIKIVTGTMHVYDRQGTGLLANEYLTDLARVTGNPFNLAPNMWTPFYTTISADGTENSHVSTRKIGVAYLPDSNYTVFCFSNGKNSAAINIDNTYIGSANF